jgi:hypothetical protein
MAEPKLQPLKQWYCDTCGKIIQKPDQGYLEWRDKEVGSGDNRRRVMYGFRIVHHALYSPYKESRDGCYYSNAERGGDLDLPFFLGTQGLIEAANWIDLGSAWDSVYRGPEVEDLREWAVIFRRLHLPYYEEARPYLEQAKSGVEFGDNNEVSFYLPETLKEIIKFYTEEQ